MGAVHVGFKTGEGNVCQINRLTIASTRTAKSGARSSLCFLPPVTRNVRSVRFAVITAYQLSTYAEDVAFMSDIPDELLLLVAGAALGLVLTLLVQPFLEGPVQRLLMLRQQGTAE